MSQDQDHQKDSIFSQQNCMLFSLILYVGIGSSS